MSLVLQTHVQDDRGSQCMILDHLQYMTKVNINLEPEHEDLPSFYWLPKLHIMIRTLMGKGLLQRQIDVLLNCCLNCLLLA